MSKSSMPCPATCAVARRIRASVRPSKASARREGMTMSDNQSSPALLSRRGLLKGGAALSGLIISAYLPPMVSRSFAADVVKGANLGDGAEKGYGAFVRIDHTGAVTVISPKIEMGQGVQTGIAMMVA